MRTFGQDCDLECDLECNPECYLECDLEHDLDCDSDERCFRHKIESMIDNMFILSGGGITETSVLTMI